MITFSSVTMNLIIEFLKFIFSLFAFIYFKQIPFNQLSLLKQSIPYSIPAILYFLNNNLAVHMQIHMDPTSYQILSNFKIFTTMILYRLIIQQKLTKQQCFALLLLFLAGLSYSIGTFKNSSSISKSTVNSNIIIQEMYIDPLGIPMIIIYCTLSGLAGVYNEWILKRNYHESIHLQNIFLYTYGTFFNFVSTVSLIMTNAQSIDRFNLFHGFSLYTWIIVFTQVLNGLFMSVVMKHSSNMTRLFVISFSLIVTTVLSLFIFHINLNIYFLISFFIMICALSLFYTN
jgi:probable UDP-sugar transporter A4